MPTDKTQVTVVRNYSNTSHEKDAKSGLFVEQALPHYDLKKIVGAADVRIGGVNKPVKAFLVGSSLSHEELAEVCAFKHYEVTVLDAQRV